MFITATRLSCIQQLLWVLYGVICSNSRTRKATVRLILNNGEMSDGSSEICSGAFHTISCTCYPACHIGLKKKIAVEGTTGPSQQLPAQNPTSEVQARRNAPTPTAQPAALTRGNQGQGGPRRQEGTGSGGRHPASPYKPGPRRQRLTKVRGRRPALRPRASRCSRRESVPGLRRGPARGDTWPCPRLPL